MWCSPCAPLSFSSCSVQRDTLQFVPSRCLLRAATSAIQWFSEPVFYARCQILDEGRTLLLVFRWRNSAGSVPVIVCRGRRFIVCSVFFPLIFQQNVGRAFCARLPRSALFGRGCLTEEGVPGSLFHPIYSLRNKRSLYAKGGLSRQGERDCFSVTFPKIWIPLGTESERDYLCCQSYLYRLMYKKEVLGYGDHTEHKIRCSVTGSLCSVFEFMGLQSKSRHKEMSTWCRFTCLSVHVYPYYLIWTVHLLQTIGIKQWGGVNGNKNCCIQYRSLFSAL